MQIIIAKDMMSAMGMLTDEIDESTSKVIDHSMVSYSAMIFRDKSHREQCNLSISRRAQCRMRIDDACLGREG